MHLWLGWLFGPRRSLLPRKSGSCLTVSMDHSGTGPCISFVQQSQLVHMIRVQESGSAQGFRLRLELAYTTLPLILVGKNYSQFRLHNYYSTGGNEITSQRWPQREDLEGILNSSITWRMTTRISTLLIADVHPEAHKACMRKPECFHLVHEQMS